MTTLSEITLRIAREVTDVLPGTATAGAATSLTDTVNLVQQNQYYDKGTLWILSGDHSGKVLAVTGFAANKLTFATLGGTPIDAGDRYAVARHIFPYNQIVQAITQALDEVKIIEEDVSLIGDGDTLEFTLPVGVDDVTRVELEPEIDPNRQAVSHHWKVRDGVLRFDTGYPPTDGEIVHVWHKTDHAALTDYDDEIDTSVNIEWLKWKAAEHLLYWGIQVYGNAKEYRIEELMNKVMGKQRGVLPRKSIAFMVHTGGG